MIVFSGQLELFVLIFSSKYHSEFQGIVTYIFWQCVQCFMITIFAKVDWSSVFILRKSQGSCQTYIFISTYTFFNELKHPLFTGKFWKILWKFYTFIKLDLRGYPRIKILFSMSRRYDRTIPNYYTYFMPEIFLSIILKYSLLYFVFTKIDVISIETDMIDICDYYIYFWFFN